MSLGFPPCPFPLVAQSLPSSWVVLFSSVLNVLVLHKFKLDVSAPSLTILLLLSLILHLYYFHLPGNLPILEMFNLPRAIVY